MPHRHDHGSPRVLVVYDGSADADAAVELAAAAFPGARAKLLSVRVRLPVGAERAEEAMRELARGAAERARDLGLEAEPIWHADGADVAQAIVEAAGRERADVIVTGRRGLADHRPSSGGSVAEEVVRQADRPVLVVPAARTATGLRAAVGARAVPNGGMRVQVVPLEDV